MRTEAQYFSGDFYVYLPQFHVAPREYEGYRAVQKHSTII